MEAALQEASVIAGITIDPPAGRWREWLAAARANERTARFRQQLGLPTDRPIVMSGHQAGFWHAGILAKYLAMSAACEAGNAGGASGCVCGGAWIIVDQDDNDAGLVRVPVRDGEGRLREARWKMLGREGVSGRGAANGSGEPARGMAGVPTGSAPARPVRIDAGVLGRAAGEGRATPALASVQAGLERIERAMNEHTGEASLARQIGSATRTLVRQLGIDPAGATELVYATDLARTDVCAWLIERMLADPGACVVTYNDAVTRHPESGMARLRVPGQNAATSATARDAFELPLWSLGSRDRGATGGQPRRRVTSATLREAAASGERLAPRALLMTAILRLAGCDLFIHGTGGAAYDRVTDEWIHNWLGETLAPTAMVTATMRLPLGMDAGGAVAAARAAWVAHRARHDPALLGDAAAAAKKRELVDEIRAARVRGEHPAAAYRAMHAVLVEARSRHADRLRALDEDAERAEAVSSEAALAADRTWAFTFYAEEDLARLAGEIRARFGKGMG